MLRAGIQLREDAHARYDRLRRIRKHICRMSNREFDKILQKKGSSGALRFDHEDATLKMTYQKDNQDETTQIDKEQFKTVLKKCLDKAYEGSGSKAEATVVRVCRSAISTALTPKPNAWTTFLVFATVLECAVR